MVVDYQMVDRPIFSFLIKNKKETIDKKIQIIIEDSYNQVYFLLENHKDLLEWFSNKLLESKTLSKYNLTSVLKEGIKIYPSVHVKF